METQYYCGSKMGMIPAGEMGWCINVPTDKLDYLEFDPWDKLGGRSAPWVVLLPPHVCIGIHMPTHNIYVKKLLKLEKWTSS